MQKVLEQTILEEATVEEETIIRVEITMASTVAEETSTIVHRTIIMKIIKIFFLRMKIIIINTTQLIKEARDCWISFTETP